MFAWFQRLLPRRGNFFELFESHAATLVAGANALSRMLQGGEGMADHVREIIEREHDADAITREVLQTVRRDLPHPVRPQRDHRPDRLDGRCDRRDAEGRGRGRPLRTSPNSSPRCATWPASSSTAARLDAEALPLLRDVGATACACTS